MEELQDQFDVLDTLLEEAVDHNFDQLLMVSRPDASHLYMLSKGRVKKGIPFERDITGAFVEYFTEREFPEQMQSLQCEMNVTKTAGLGECYLVKIRKKP